MENNSSKIQNRTKRTYVSPKLTKLETNKQKA